MGCFTGDHADFKTCNVIDYAGAFVLQGEPDPLDIMMGEFLKEEVEFADMPPEVRSWK